jgi:hypothetical protein
MPVMASNLASGIYFVNIVVNEQQRHVEKIIIHKE